MKSEPTRSVRTTASVITAAVAALLTLVATPAMAANEEISFTPPNPTELDPITVTLTGEWPDSCTPELVGASLENGTLSILANVEFPDVVCSLVITPYEVSINVGRLPAGSYDVTVVTTSETEPEVLATEELEVSASASVDLGLDTIGVSPEQPTTQDRVSITAHGTWPDGCIPRLQDVEIEDLTIQLFAVAEGNFCIEVISDYTLATTVGPLAQGQWQVEVLIADRRSDDDEAPFELAGRRTFTVGAQSSDVLILGGRFRVTATWTNGVDRSGVGQPLRGGLPDEGDSGSGAFYFFEPVNTELLVKVLDACAVNDRFWVFISAATDLGIEVEVVDTEADETRTYTNEPGEPARAVTDTDAFATCDEP